MATKKQNSQDTKPTSGNKKHSLSDIVKDALAQKQQQPLKNDQLNTNEKDYRIGMPPRGTRRSMGKR